MNELPLNQIINGDCLEFMKTLPDNCIDLVVTDPPYGDNIGYGRNDKEILNNEDESINYKFLEIIYSKMKINTTMYLFSNWKFEVLLRNWITKNSKFNIRMLLIIVKNNIGMGFNFRNQYEVCLVLEKGNPKYNLNNFSNIMNMDNIVHSSETHPHTKALNIGRQILNHSSKCGDLVFDGFAGSGSFLIACKKLGRNFIGCELDISYYDIANKRLRETEPETCYATQTRLF